MQACLTFIARPLSDPVSATGNTWMHPYASPPGPHPNASIPFRVDGAWIYVSSRSPFSTPSRPVKPPPTKLSQRTEVPLVQLFIQQLLHAYAQQQYILLQIDSAWPLTATASDLALPRQRRSRGHRRPAYLVIPIKEACKILDPKTHFAQLNAPENRPTPSSPSGQTVSQIVHQWAGTIQHGNHQLRWGMRPDALLHHLRPGKKEAVSVSYCLSRAALFDLPPAAKATKRCVDTCRNDDTKATKRCVGTCRKVKIQGFDRGEWVLT